MTWVVVGLIAYVGAFWLAHRADRWFRHRALMKELERIGFDWPRRI
jgi:hypothetical protein